MGDQPDISRFSSKSFTSAVDNGNLQLFRVLISSHEEYGGHGSVEGGGQGVTAEGGANRIVELLSLSVFGDGEPLLHYMCAKPNIDPQFIKTLLHKGVDVNLTSPLHGRPIHVACLNNCPDNLKLLLDYGAKINANGDQAWEESSPFYIASLYGHLDIAQILYSYQPKLIQDDDVRSCLLYAACAGGNMDIVSMWYSPVMDINQPKPYIHSLDNSGDNTPIFAACSGGHYELAKHLVTNMGARLTQKACTEYPEITGKILAEFVKQVPTEADADVTEIQHSADYSSEQLSTLHGDWLRTYTVTLVTINISQNSIQELPPEIPWSFPNLQHFNASHNALERVTCGTKPHVCRSLKTIWFNNNKLEFVCTELFQIPALEQLKLNHNNLQYLVKEYRGLDYGSTNEYWTCESLNCLDVSHNQLNMLPSTIKQCSALTTLDASHNCLTSFCGGWDCSLTSLNLSFNNLERFPADIELYWCGSLLTVNLDHNKLEVLTDSIVKVGALTDLIVSNNVICALPRPEVWDCRQLYTLNLHSNNLGRPRGPTSPKATFGSRFSATRKNPSLSIDIALPKFLMYCLHYLNLSDNQLDCVPKGICHLASLTVLNLSGNPGIKTLPEEMGNLSALTTLHLEDVPVKLPVGISQDPNQRSKDVITYLQHQLRKCKHYNKIKLVILGKKDKGKTTLACLLHGNKTTILHGSGIQRFEFKLPATGKQLFKRNNQDITFSVWDMACSDHYLPAQQCFFTKNSLYILVWDIWSLKNERELEKLGNWLYSIEARTPHSRVILVATFLDNKYLTSQERDEKVNDIIDVVIDRYGTGGSNSLMCSHLDRNNIIPVSCTTNEGIPNLKQMLINIASSMYDPSKGMHDGRLLSRKVPQSYLLVEEAVKQKLSNKLANDEPPFLKEDEFQDLVKSVRYSDITTEQDIKAVAQFLVETGSLLHYSDQLRGLNTLYILDPTWLIDLLAKVLVDDEDGITSPIGNDGKILVTDVVKKYKGDVRFPNKYIDQYLQLLERFEIALSVDSGKRLFVPSRLSQTPGLEHTPEHGGTNVCRLYQMAFIPTGFWSRLLSCIMTHVELLGQSKWALQSSHLGSVHHSRLQHTVVGRQFTGAGIGLQIKRKDMIYWQDGMYMRHTKGYLKLETIRIPKHSNHPPQSGILVVVHSNEDDFSIMGTIVDAIDDLLADHYPGLSEWDEYGQPRIQRYALCPCCYAITTRSMPATMDQFTVKYCSQMILKEKTIICKTGSRIPLGQLVPELLIQELPKEHHLDVTRLDVKEKDFLGRGVTGSVYKGRYGNVEVAVKYYHGIPEGSPSSKPETIDSGKGTLPHRSSKPETIDSNPSPSYHDEGTGWKAWTSFMAMRQEVAVTSKLQHPCVISFIGICVKPKMLMCLEFAPLGDLRCVLDSEMKQKARPPFNKHRDKDRLFSTVLSKDMTFKMVFQIASGLLYLHQHRIIYRDLKSDNILVTTLDLSAPVNVKLSDYGISKFYSSGGTLGLVGTPGYQAPEIMAGQFYDEKVDIFSFAMVIYEVLSGGRPYGELQNTAQITTAIRQEAKRPSLQHYNVDTRFPQLERLMTRCWTDNGTDRPTSMDIVTDLRTVHFLCQHKQFDTHHEEIDCMAPVTDGNKQRIWLWEGSETGRVYHIIDLATCTYHERKCLAGPAVTCMCKVDKEVWIGAEGQAGDGVLEIYTQHTSGRLRCKYSLSCDGIPTNILYIEHQTEEKVYVTLHNGRLRVYTPSPPSSTRDNRWTCLLHSESLSPSQASCVLYIQSTDELWIGCGPEIIVYCNKTSLVVHTISVGTIAKAFLPNHQTSIHIQSIVQGDGRVWCLLEHTACVIEIDTETSIPTHLFDCDLQNPGGMNVVKDIHNNTNPMVCPVITEKNNSTCIVNSIAVVGDTIWASRRNGDILLICTLNYESFRKGEVIAVLNCKDESRQMSDRVPEWTSVERLLCVNQLVVSIVCDGMTSSRLVAWEAYSCKDIANIRRYWNVKKTSNEHSQSTV